MKRQFLKTFLAASAMAVLAACGGGDDHPAAPVAVAPTKNVVELAQGTGDLSILVEAVVAAGLAPTLSGTGPFTVFAPTNAAFAAALTELGLTKDQLLAPANKPLLTSILTYHVVSGKVLKAQVPLGTPIATVQGESFTVDASLAITDQRGRKAAITATDILATNGVVHLIDKVILPTDKNIVQVAQGNPDFSILVEAVIAADLVSTLSGTNSFTVFAPTNEAFAKLPAGTVDNLLKPEMKKDLTNILTYHVVAGKLMAADLKDGQKLKTVEGGELTVSVKAGKVMINGANVTIADVVSSNGVTHVIDAVLMPKK